jgi:hypothetical protein
MNLVVEIKEAERDETENTYKDLVSKYEEKRLLDDIER